MPFPTDVEHTDRAAAKLGVAFSASYVERILRENGGTVEVDGDEWQLYPVFDDTDAKRAKRTCNDVVRETAEARTWPTFPGDAVAIACDGSGDLLVMLTDSAPALGAPIYKWSHESGDLVCLAGDLAELDAG